MTTRQLEPREALFDLARLVERAATASFQDALETGITERFYDGVRATYDAQGDPIGRAWRELSPGYLRWKERNYPGLPILVLTGDMRASAIGENAADRRIEPREANYWVPQPYAAAHQFGTQRIPQRWFFGANEETKSAIEELVADAFTAMIG